MKVLVCLDLGESLFHTAKHSDLYFLVCHLDQNHSFLLFGRKSSEILMIICPRIPFQPGPSTRFWESQSEKSYCCLREWHKSEFPVKHPWQSTISKNVGWAMAVLTPVHRGFVNGIYKLVHCSKLYWKAFRCQEISHELQVPCQRRLKFPDELNKVDWCKSCQF